MCHCGFLNLASCIPILTHASPLPIHAKSRMRDPSGNRTPRFLRGDYIARGTLGGFLPRHACLHINWVSSARKAGESRRRVPARAVPRSERPSPVLGSQEQREPLRPACRREGNRLLRGSSKFGCFFSDASPLVRCGGRRERASSVERNAMQCRLVLDAALL
jgi:hypothetical protein